MDRFSTAEPLAQKWMDSAGRIRWQPRAVLSDGVVLRWETPTPKTIWWLDDGMRPASDLFGPTLYRSRTLAERVARGYMKRIYKEDLKNARGFRRVSND